MTLRVPALVALVLMAVGGCAAPVVAPPTAAAPAPTDPVSRAAEWLAQADSQVVSSAKRAELVAALDRLGMTHADDSDDDPMARWRAEAAAGGHATLPFRGRALGPAYRSGWLEPGANKALDQLFLAGETARISLTNADRLPMALTIIDPNSKVICQENGPPPGRCQWVALFTQRYRIELSNRGQTRLRYFLVTN